MNIRFDGKRALVTGAGKGIGRDLALYLAELGATVVAVSRTQADLDSLKSEAPSIEPVLLDIGENWENTKSVLKKVLPIDLLVNNAGVQHREYLTVLTESAFDDVLNVNLKSAINVTQLVAKSMIERNQPGSIVNISSAASFKGLPMHTSYSSSKSALDSFTRCAAIELGPKQIRINSVNPTAVMTDMGKLNWPADAKETKDLLSRVPIGKLPDPRDVSNVVVFLLSDKASMIHGVSLPIEGGLLCS